MKRLILLATIPVFTLVLTAFTSSDTRMETPVIQTGTNIGDQAPDLTMQSPDGKTYKLSDLRGQMVLVDFWASWCGPCRKENPQVVGAYEKYSKAKFKDAKGFQVFSVSLDSNVDNWKAAISQDNLSWKTHVCDFGGWNSAAAATYGVRSIPMGFLLDQNGIIVAKGLRGLELHKKIDEYVKSF